MFENSNDGWASEAENGQRGFGITGAHHHKSWDNDDGTCANAILWTANMEVPQGGGLSPIQTPPHEKSLHPKFRNSKPKALLEQAHQFSNQRAWVEVKALDQGFEKPLSDRFGRVIPMPATGRIGHTPG